MQQIIYATLAAEENLWRIFYPGFTDTFESLDSALKSLGDAGFDWPRDFGAFLIFRKEA